MATQTNTTTVPAPGADDTPHLTGSQGVELAGIVVAGIVAVGAIIVWARWLESNTKGDSEPQGNSEPRGSVVRSWVAVSLVLGLLAFCAVAFAIGDKTSRSALLGALTASVGAAIAFYFSSKASETTVAAVVKAHSNES
jgi:hypothetical protein